MPLALGTAGGPAGVIGGIAGLQTASFVAENSEVRDAHFLQGELQRSQQYPEPIFDAAAEVDGRRLIEILGGAGDLAEAEAEMRTLREHLIVKDKVIGILEQGQLGQHFAAEGAVAGVVFGKLDSQKQILKRSEEAVGDVLVERHAAMQCLPSQNARAQHN